MAPQYVLALDPATSTGWARFRLDDGVAALEGMGALPVENTTPYQGDAMLSLRTQVAALLDAMPEAPTMCHVETFFFSKRFCNGSDLNLLLRGAIYQLLRERGAKDGIHDKSAYLKHAIEAHERVTKSEWIIMRRVSSSSSAMTSSSAFCRLLMPKFMARVAQRSRS